VPGGSTKPVGSSLELPAFDWMPGHTVPVHRFTNVKVAALPSATMNQTRRFSTPSQELPKQLLFNDRITSEEYANQNKNDDENSCNTHVLEAMQLCVVGGNGNRLEQEEVYNVSTVQLQAISTSRRAVQLRYC
jgi:hypothetical protein